MFHAEKNFSLPNIGRDKHLVKINKEAYYYVEALSKYKQIFSDPKKVEEIVLKFLNNIPAFRNFAEQNSPLSTLFASLGSLPSLSTVASTPIINGLPSRASLQQYMQANIPSLTKLNPVEQIRNKLPEIQPELNKLKKAANDLSGMKNKSLKDFKPNSQRNKPFVKRLEFSTDLQFGKSTNYLPATTDIAVKAGYKLNDKSSTGVGINYKMGLGNGWNKIKISSEGLGLRTYLKWKVKGSLDIQGGSEWNYMLQKTEQLKYMNVWQQSALIGLSKQFKAVKKMKGNIQVLYNFLYNKQPNKQPLVFRFGYGF